MILARKGLPVQRGKVVIGVNTTTPIFGLMGKDGQPEGYDPDVARLIGKYLGPIPLAAGLSSQDIVGRIRGISPADLEALVSTAKRMAMNRIKDGDAVLPPLIWEDFEQALKRNQVSI